MLNAKQRSFLSSLAVKESMLTHLGKAGPTAQFAAQLSLLLEHHELVKVRFVNFKEEKRTIAEELAVTTSSELVRLIGNTALFYKRNPDPEIRRIELP